MLIALDISVDKVGTEKLLNDKPFLIVSNHISYLDIIILASITPAVFVAKSDVAHWTLLGWLAKLGGTIFVHRTAFRSGISAAGQISDTLKNGTNVVVFPEGTSTNGKKVLPFKPSVFLAAHQSNVPILPITIQYTSINRKSLSDENRDVVSWYGSMEFAGHFWNLLRYKNICAQIIIHDTMKYNKEDSVHTLAAASQKIIESGLMEEKIILQQAPVLRP